MANYTGPVCRLCRREGAKLYLKGAKCVSNCTFDKRNALLPGQHGMARRRKLQPKPHGRARRSRLRGRLFGPRAHCCKARRDRVAGLERRVDVSTPPGRPATMAQANRPPAGLPP